MKSAFSTATLAILAYILQTSLFASFFAVMASATGMTFLYGHTVNLALIMLVYLVLNRNMAGALIWSILFGMIGAAFGLTWNGALATGMFVVGLTCSLLRNQILFKDTLSISLFAGLMVFLEGLVHLHIGKLLSSIHQPLTTHLGFMIVQILIDALFAPGVFALLRVLDLWMGVTQTRRRSLIVDI